MRISRRHPQATVLGACILAVLTSAAAYAAPAEELAAAEATTPSKLDAAKDQELTEVVVTGSRIRRTAASAPTPLIQVSRADLTNTGMGNIIDVLADVPALSGSIVPEDTTGSGLNDGGLSLLNLRDLGSNRTLTLVDGRRHVGSSSGSLAVDVDTIPRLLIERVELVTGANSAQYGADAVSGVVNFILRRNFSGVEVDATRAEINSDGQSNDRISVLAGHNFFDGRLNVYGPYEREANDEVRDSDIPWRAQAWGFLARDFDPASAPSDGVVDNVLVSGIRNLSRSRGGTLTLVSDMAPNAALNIPNQRCPAGTTGSINALCIINEPGLTYQFAPNGAARLANFGTMRNMVGRSRSNNVGGDGLNINTEFSQFSRLPRSKNDRWQGGFNFDITENAQIFGEMKYVTESTYDESQQTFFDIGIVNIAANTDSRVFGTSSFNIGLDNAYLDPAVKAAILANRRATFTTAGVPTGATVSDPRARLSIFGPSRSQLNEKELTRYVAGIRGSFPEVGAVKNVSYELSFTHGELKNVNYETAVDVMRFKHSVDAVVDTAGLVSGKPGEIVCRVKLLLAQGIAVPDQLRGGNYSPTNPEIAGCVPSRVFGEGGYSAAAMEYFGATINVQDKNTQDDVLGFVSGDIGDFWGAGPMGFALGSEWRKEATSSIGRSTSTGDRLLFLNTGPDFPEAKYTTKEVFGEIRVPLLKGKFLAETLELGGAFRQSDYTTVGSVDTYNYNLIWRPVSDVTFRATSGRAVRVPNLAENFRPPTQTFANGFVDPCSATVISALTDTTVRANRERNCVAAGIPAGTVITYTSGVPGNNAGNPFLKPEVSDTHTASVIYSPRFLPKATFIADFYEIEIKDVIASVSAQTAANQCVSGETLNSAICSTITRGGASAANPYAVIDFIQGSVNYAKLVSRGVDFQFLYNTELPTVMGKNLGSIGYHLSGNYLLDAQDYLNISNPSESFQNSKFIGYPRMRFSSTLDWVLTENLGLRWKMDWQKSQRIIDQTTLAGNDDVYEDARYFDTGNFIQHDFSVQYSPVKNLTIRGGIVNAFDKKPALWLGGTSSDNFDLFGRRLYIGANFTM